MRSGWLVALLAVSACRPAPPTEVRLQITDKRERPAAGAVLTVNGGEFVADNAGELRIELPDGPVMGVIASDGLLPEPIVLAPEDLGTVVRVEMYRSDAHWAMHAGGDVMFGRRYLMPPSGDPLLDGDDPGPGARAVVAKLAPAFAAADVSVVNFESVIGYVEPEGAYPGKRFLLSSPSGATQALNAMGVDAVDLANNHARDWLDPGVQVTVDTLEGASLPTFGAGMTAEEALEPLILDVDGVTVGLIGFTSVDGSFVNDQYPVDGDPVPAEVPDKEAWLYEARTWGFEGEVLSAPVQARRAGSAWRVFKGVESQLSDEEAAAAWASLDLVYPELQDWVARRGHGGAARWQTDDARQRIAALDAEVDVVVVQIHGGFQFAPGVSEFVDAITRNAVSAGADLVVGHHPHVLQGAGFQDGTLVVHSLGNLVFDQDFLATFPSAFLRTVWNGDTLVEARLVPLELVDYRPVPLAGPDARRVLRTVWERSQLGGTSERVDGNVRLVTADRPDGSVPATLVWDRHSALLIPEAPTREVVEVTAKKDGLTDLETLGLVDPRLGLADGQFDGILVGRDLFGWGTMRDGLADDIATQGAHWEFNSPDERLFQLNDGSWVIELERDGFDDGPVTTRPVARVPLIAHRLWDEDGQAPLDPQARYAVRIRGRATGPISPQLRLVTYDFRDTDPTADPESVQVADELVELDIGRSWSDIVVEIDPSWLATDGGAQANMVLPYLVLDPPRVGRGVFQVARFEVLELRPASSMPAVPGAWDVVLNGGRRSVDLQVPVIGAP